MAVADPTLSILHQLADESLWVIRRGIPVFCAHSLTDKDGEPVRVDDARLKSILGNVRRRRNQSAMPPRLTLGHIKDDLPEKDQPDVVGWSDNWRLGTFGPKRKVCLLQDEFYYPASGEAVFFPDGRFRYPYRSAEFFPDSNEITGVALLKRDPELDLGALTYERKAAVVYSFGGRTMPEQDLTKPPLAETPGAVPPEPPIDANHPAMKFFKDNEHVLRYMCDKNRDEATKYAAEGGAMPGGMNLGPPTGEKPGEKKPEDEEEIKRKEKENFARQEFSLKYAKQEERLQALETAREQEAKKYARFHGTGLISNLVNGVANARYNPLARRIIIPDTAFEINELAAMKTDEEREARAARICLTYEKDITGGTMPTIVNLDGTKSGEPAETDGPTTERDTDGMLTYARSHGVMGELSTNPAKVWKDYRASTRK